MKTHDLSTALWALGITLFLIVGYLSLPDRYRYLVRAIPVWFGLEQHEKARITVFFKGNDPTNRSTAIAAPKTIKEPQREGDEDDGRSKVQWRAEDSETWLLSNGDPWHWDAGSDLVQKPDIRLGGPIPSVEDVASP